MMSLLGIGCCLVMLFLAAVLLTRMLEFKALDEYPVPVLESPPKVSVVVAACNEAETIEPALRRLLDDEDPDRELIVVEDRSTDTTRDILEALNGEYGEAMRVVCVDELPPGGRENSFVRTPRKFVAGWNILAGWVI